MAYPWLAITFWFPAWAVGMIFGRVGVLLYANVTTLRTEEILDTIELRPALKWTVLLLFLAALISYISFSLHRRWLGVSSYLFHRYLQ